MIDLKPLKSDSIKYPEPIKSIIEMQKDTMSVNDFIEFFMGLRKKAREMDIKNKELK
ncbi:hypothetical protein [Acidiplasma sp.]|uniref:hypothetical protein n=1 Tax=Acidiplasma sp. TaxID=1872114 RepID=UPI0025868E7E|nr:hypothetical protein [Acidiplasma sp.]